MDGGRDEEPLRGRVYGSDFDDPHPGPWPGRTYAELVGGPLDGLLLDITGWTPDEIATGAALITEIGRFGAGGRASQDEDGDARDRIRSRGNLQRFATLVAVGCPAGP